MNTIFKFYFQGWVLLACASAYAAWWVARYSGKILRAVFLAAAGLVVAAGLVYPVMAVRSRVESLRWPPILDAAASVAGVYPEHWAAQPDDWKAIQWINAKPPPSAKAQRQSSWRRPAVGMRTTGGSAPLPGCPPCWAGPTTKASGAETMTEINRRLPDIQEIYTTPSEEEALDLLHKWKRQLRDPR